MNKQSKPSSRKTKADLEKALAEKSRELQQKDRLLEIEAALERVRARSMTMLQSDELGDVIEEIYEQFQGLGFKFFACDLIIFRECKPGFDIWVSGSDGTEGPYRSPETLNDHPHHLATIEAWKNGEAKRISELTGELFTSYFDIVLGETEGLKSVSEKTKEDLMSLGKMVHTEVFTRHICIRVASLEHRSEEELAIQRRFADVFEQSFTRFLDLQKAEAQAREAQIQLALERVRARSMAMHVSEELPQVALTVLNQIELLEIPHVSCDINIVDNNTRDFVSYSAHSIGKKNEKVMDQLPQLNLNDIGFMREALKHVDKWDPYYTMELRGKFLKEMMDLWKASNFSGINNEFIRNRPEVIYLNWANFNGLSSISLSSVEPLKDEHLSILSRMAKTFALSFTRFLDLQKAEAQAREAQIETALEKVRSRTMGMQHSDELADASFLLDSQVRALGIKTRGCAFNIYGENESTEWFSSEMGTLPTYKTPRENIFLRYYEEGQKGKSMYIESFAGDACAAHYDYLCTVPVMGEALKEFKKSGGSFPAQQIDHVTYFKYGYLLFITLEPVPDAHDIFKRFAKVFEQTYTRFLDLQKAEAQAREAQIEAALERVRSRTMGMQRSDELQDAAMSLFQQVEHLGLPVFACGFNIWDDDRKAATAWMAGKDRLQPPFKTSSSEDIFLRIFEAAERGESLFVEEQEGKALKTHYEYMNSIPVFKEIADKMVKAGQSLPTFQIMHCAYFQQGYLMFISFKPVANAYNIFKRFAKVFEQTYTRFLDLQKAEAQAREAEIELALERVRARTMAMHKGDELADTALLLFEQIMQLGIKPRSCGFLIMDEESESMKDWSANLDENGKASLITGTLAFNQHPMISDVVATWRKGAPYFIGEIHGKDLQKYYKAVTSKETTSKAIKEEVLAGANSEFTNSFYFEYGMVYVLTPKAISEHETDIMLRFAKVFKQTYTRFLDLQKAEAQAEVARIEAALEKVRSRSLAMHKSEELQEVINTVYDRLAELEIEMDSANFLILSEGRRDFDLWIANPEHSSSTRIRIPEMNFTPSKEFFKSREKGRDFFTMTCTSEEKNKWFGHAYENTDLGKLPPERRKYILESDCWTAAWAISKHSAIQINRFYRKPFSESEHGILKRFAKVFEQAYIRFLDLQKAEAQAREAQIETALERVRASALAMHNSQDLVKVAGTLREQMGLLGQPQLESAVIELYDLHKDYIESWHTFVPAAKKDGTKLSGKELFHKDSCSLLKELIRMYKSSQKEYTIVSKGKKQKDFIKILSKQIPEVAKVKMPDLMYYSCSDFTGGTLVIGTLEEPSKESKELLSRASRVFDLAYRRFLDLQKAEAQAREAQIEAALERVRARTMAMHKSSELREVVGEFFSQAQQLGFEIQMFVIFIFKPNGGLEWWGTEFGKEGLPQSYDIPALEEFKSHPRARNLIDIRKKKRPYQVYELVGDNKKSWDKILLERTGLKQLPSNIKKGMKSLDRIVLCDAVCNHGILEVAGPVALSEEKANILQRFTRVFEQTYTRFVDVQKAEAQAREAQIEASLERVRARTMAMHKSQELIEVISEAFDQLRQLRLRMDGAMIHIFEEEAEEFQLWIQDTEDSFAHQTSFPFFDHPIITSFRKAKEGERSFMTDLCSVEYKNQFFEWAFEHSDLKMLSQERKDYILSLPGYARSIAISPLTAIAIDNFDGLPYSEEENQILKRIGKVFEQTYTRFLDLQKAEAQAREAQIEAALERVRARAMAMHKTEEQNELIGTMFTELGKLDVVLLRSVIELYDPDTFDQRWWMANSEQPEKPVSFFIKYIDLPPNIAFVKAWKEKPVKWVYLMKGDVKKEWDERMLTETELSLLPESVKAGMRDPAPTYCNTSFNNFGCLTFVSQKPLSDDHFDIIIKFSKVFDQAYTRFNDLQRAEAREKEAIKQSSLDRVRAEIASMRTADDLNRITPLIWRELTTLNVPFFRCGVFIVDEPSEQAHVYLSTPSGESLAAMHLEYGTTPLVDSAVHSWRKEQFYIEKWDRDQFLQWTKSIVDQGLVESPEKYQAGEEPPEMLVLQFVPFKQGMLYVGSSESLSNDQIELVHALADAFSVAYARYEDFKLLEEAKQRVEGTLTELKSTQSQLIQSEKMASLGELTAGIAHEIQNPLNFVNNFSEVNTEMLEELSEELQNGNLEEAASLIKDMLENEHKIVHHGRRAEAIVKSMLQHSRGSSGKKEPTDINDLADEYLRLAYHGMRARDKSFNAAMHTDFDDSIGKLNIVPQEIGRVLLNLITNAFYAVTERQKLDGKDYQPTVWVSTKKLNNRVEIRVKDNGTGIPQKVLDKIFQPFFSTKPTGQGTGLGLSLSYDIVKAHGGELKVQTEEGAGSEFIVQLPV